jgi:hypothetical protein
MVAEDEKVDQSDMTVSEHKHTETTIDEEGLSRPCRPSQDDGHR